MERSSFLQLQGLWIFDFKKGSQIAFNKLYECTWKILYSWLCKAYPNTPTHEIEDAIAEAYKRVFIRRDTFESESHVRRALHVYCKRILIDVDRGRKAQIAYVKDTRYVVSEFENPLENGEWGGVSFHDVMNEILNLSESQFWVIYFSFFEGLSKEEIADRMGLATQTVLNVRNDGVIKLRKKLAIRILPSKSIFIKKSILK